MFVLPFPVPTHRDIVRNVIAGAWLFLPVTCGVSGLVAWNVAQEWGTWEREQTREMVVVAASVVLAALSTGVALASALAAAVVLPEPERFVGVVAAIGLMLWLVAVVGGGTAVSILQAINVLNAGDHAATPGDQLTTVLAEHRATRPRVAQLHRASRIPTSPSPATSSE